MESSKLLFLKLELRKVAKNKKRLKFGEPELEDDLCYKYQAWGRRESLSLALFYGWEVKAMIKLLKLDLLWFIILLIIWVSSLLWHEDGSLMDW